MTAGRVVDVFVIFKVAPKLTPQSTTHTTSPAMCNPDSWSPQVEDTLVALSRCWRSSRMSVTPRLCGSKLSQGICGDIDCVVLRLSRSCSSYSSCTQSHERGQQCNWPALQIAPDTGVASVLRIQSKTSCHAREAWLEISRDSREYPSDHL